MGKVTVREIIVVEGKYDKNALAQVANAEIIVLDGFEIYKNAEKLALLRALGAERGVILLTDSDEAGFQLRSFLLSALGGIEIKQAYIPQIAGVERRKRRASSAGLLGVEGMDGGILLAALRDCGATLDGDANKASGGSITAYDMFEWGLSGGEGSKAKRAELLAALELPSMMSAKALLRVLNVLGRGRIEKFIERGENVP